MKRQLKLFLAIAVALTAFVGCGKAPQADGIQDLDTSKLQGTWAAPCRKVDPAVTEMVPSPAGTVSRQYSFSVSKDTQYQEMHRFFSDADCKTEMVAQKYTGPIERLTLGVVSNASSKIYNYEFTGLGVVYYDIIQLSIVSGKSVLFFGDINAAATDPNGRATKLRTTGFTKQ